MCDTCFSRRETTQEKTLQEEASGESTAQQKRPNETRHKQPHAGGQSCRHRAVRTPHHHHMCSSHDRCVILFFYSPFSALHIYLPIRQFFYDIIHPEYSPVCDVYALMFLVDVANFIVIIFGYWAFGVSVTHHDSVCVCVYCVYLDVLCCLCAEARCGG